MTRTTARASCCFRIALLGFMLLHGVLLRAEPALIAVAASVAPAIEEIVSGYEATGAAPVRLSVGASGILTQQIRRGAPFELFLSADRTYPDRLCREGLCEGKLTPYVKGRLVLYVAHGVGDVGPGAPLTETWARELLLATPPGRIAIANPAHAPYGRAAREVLEHLGLWIDLQSRLIVGDSVSQAARFAAATSVSLAILPRSVEEHPWLAKRTLLLIPGEWHAPLIHYMTLLRGAGAEAQTFYDYLLSEDARRIFTQHGYDPPTTPD